MAASRTSSSRLKIEHLVVVLGLGGLIALSAIGMVWRKTVVHQLGRELKESKLKAAELEKQHDSLRREYDLLRSPAALEIRVKALNLGLAFPTPEQVIKLPEPSGRVGAQDLGGADAPRSVAPRLILGEIHPVGAALSDPPAPSKGSP